MCGFHAWLNKVRHHCQPIRSQCLWMQRTEFLTSYRQPQFAPSSLVKGYCLNFSIGIKRQPETGYLSCSLGRFHNQIWVLDLSLNRGRFFPVHFLDTEILHPERTLPTYEAVVKHYLMHWHQVNINNKEREVNTIYEDVVSHFF